MPSPSEKDAVVELLAQLSDHGDQQSASETGPVAQKRGELASLYPPANREKLTGIFAKSDLLDLRRIKAFVYGPTVRDAGQILLPVVTMNANFGDARGSWISIYVMCWVFSARKWHVLPLRFERPPHDHMTGAHGYNHVQFFWSLFDNTHSLPDGDDMKWLPHKQPAIPLPQDQNSPAILAAAIVSLYGLTGARSYMASLQETQFSFLQSSVMTPVSGTSIAPPRKSKNSKQ